jgi:hypothetical protein
MDEYGFEARLRHLEHIISGQNQPKTTQIAVLKRVETLRKELHTVYKNNKSIRDFVEKCKRQQGHGIQFIYSSHFHSR